MKTFNWKIYEAELLRCIGKAVREVMAEYPEEEFYGAAFHSFYREHGDQIGLPCLAVNTEEELEENSDLRWSAPDWYWDNFEYESSALIRLHGQLNDLAASEDDSHWEALHDQWMDALIRVAKRLSTTLRKKKQATKDFGFFLFESEKIPRGCDSWTQKSLFGQRGLLPSSCST